MTPYGKKLTSVGIAIALILSAFVSGVYLGYANQPEALKVIGVSNMDSGAPENVDFSPFWRAWNVINEKYAALDTPSATGTPLKKVTAQDKVYGAIEGLFRSLDDPYTVFFPPEEAKMFEEEVQGSFEGVGMEIGIRDDALTVVAPLKDTPAFTAGIRAGDKILKIDGKSAAGLPVDVAVRQIRGKKGTVVRLTIERAGEGEKEFAITRDRIQIPTISIEGDPVGKGSTEKKEGIRSDGVFVIRLYNFSAQSPELFRKALQKFADSRSAMLILDLRGNPGGYLDAAVDMASWFLPSDKVVVSERSGAGASQETREHMSRGYDIFTDKLRMVILVDRGSASASEILAGALQEYGIAKLVGERTFGKGSVQELVKITGDTEAKITIARWFTPKGRSISESGLTPDYPVAITKEDIDKKSDPQFDKALEVIKSNSLW